MSMELYESTRKKWEVYRDIEISEEQIRHGRTKNARKALESGVFHELEDYGKKVIE